MSKKTILLIDGENILHQSFHKFEKLKSTDGKPSGAIFGFFKSLHMYLTRFEPDEVYVSFDNGHSPVRMELLPNYKGHRKNLSVDYESLQNQKSIQGNSTSKITTAPSYTIPVVFHILHMGGVENISDAQVNSQITVLITTISWHQPGATVIRRSHFWPGF